jgi:hypothetical protein
LLQPSQAPVREVRLQPLAPLRVAEGESLPTETQPVMVVVLVAE